MEHRADSTRKHFIVDMCFKFVFMFYVSCQGLILEKKEGEKVNKSFIRCW